MSTNIPAKVLTALVYVQLALCAVAVGTVIARDRPEPTQAGQQVSPLASIATVRL